MHDIVVASVLQTCHPQVQSINEVSGPFQSSILHLSSSLNPCELDSKTISTTSHFFLSSSFFFQTGFFISSFGHVGRHLYQVENKKSACDLPGRTEPTLRGCVVASRPGARGALYSRGRRPTAAGPARWEDKEGEEEESAAIKKASPRSPACSECSGPPEKWLQPRGLPSPPRRPPLLTPRRRGPRKVAASPRHSRRNAQPAHPEPGCGCWLGWGAQQGQR